MPRIDDPDIPNDALLLRRVLDKPAEWYYKTDDGELKVSSAAFRDSLNEVSVNVAVETTVENVLDGREEDGLVCITAGVPRERNHIISKTTESDDPDDPSHRVICPNNGVSSGQIRKAAKAMSMAATWLVFPSSERDSATNHK